MFDDTATWERLQAFVACEPATADRAELDRIVELCTQVQALVAAVEVAVARRTRELQTSLADQTPSEVLAGRGRRGRKQGRAAAQREEACTTLPSFEDALANGSVTPEHVDALARGTRGLDEATKSAVAGFEDDLLAAAQSKSPEEFEREVRDLAKFVSGDDGADRLSRQKNDRRVRRWVDRDSGMYKLFGEWDPETGAKLWAAIDAHLESLKQRAGNNEVPLERLSADTVVELITRVAVGEERRVPEVCVHIDWATLRTGMHAGSICELSNGIPLPVATVRRLCCEATVVPILLGPDGTPVDAGRELRTANRKQRRLLAAMYRTCGHPHCDVPFEYCDIHHVKPWLPDGRTDLDNLLPLCSRHHHLVHEGGWTLTMTPDRVITLTRPDGTPYHQGSTVDRHPGTTTTDAAAAGDTTGDTGTSGAPPGRRAAA